MRDGCLGSKSETKQRRTARIYRWCMTLNWRLFYSEKPGVLFIIAFNFSHSLTLAYVCCCSCISSSVQLQPILINSTRHDTIRVSSQLSWDKKMLLGWYRSAIISLQHLTALFPPGIRLSKMVNMQPPVLIWYDRVLSWRHLHHISTPTSCQYVIWAQMLMLIEQWLNSHH